MGLGVLGYMGRGSFGGGLGAENNTQRVLYPEHAFGFLRNSGINLLSPLRLNELTFLHFGDKLLGIGVK